MHTSSPPAAQVTPNEQKAIWLLLGSAFVVILNETLMGVALPVLMEDLSITASTGQWLTTAFLLTMSIVIPITGMLIQRLRTRTLFISAMSLFLIGTVLGALAPGFGVLLIGRVVQAAGTAVMMPLLMTTVVTLVPPAIRGSMMGRISIVISVAPALGPTISGFILQFFEWRMIFVFVIPFVIIALIWGFIALPNVGTSRNVRIDVLSVLLSALGFGGLVYGLSSLGESANHAVPISPTVALIVGGIALLLLVLRQLPLQRKNEALLDLRVFSSYSFTISTVVMAIGMMALFGSLIVLPIVLQSVLGAGTLGTGLLLLPGGVLMGVLAPTVGKLVDRLGVRPILVPGLLFVVAGLGVFTLVGQESGVWLVLVAHLILSVGLAATFTPLFTAAFATVPGSLTSYASAILSTLQQVAGAAGTAAFVTVMSLVAAQTVPNDPASPEALVAGAHASFLLGLGVAVVACALAWFVTPKPSRETALPETGS